jgi:hypothetical protein
LRNITRHSKIMLFCVVSHEGTTNTPGDIAG